MNSRQADLKKKKDACHCIVRELPVEPRVRQHLILPGEAADKSLLTAAGTKNGTAPWGPSPEVPRWFRQRVTVSAGSFSPGHTC